MKKSLFTTLDVHADVERAQPQRYADAIEQATLADQLGFDCFWLGEHHFRDVGTVPNPAVLLAAIAARTDRIRLGPAVSVLALRDPILTAEEYAMLDVISNGRLNLGVGTGAQAAEFEGLGRDFDGRREVFSANLQALLDRWTATGDARRAPLNVRPVQSPPPVYVATATPEVARGAGRAGHSLLAIASPSLPDLEALQPLLQAHAHGLGECPRKTSAEAVLTFITHVAPTEERALKDAATALGRLIEVAQGHRPDDARGLCESMRDRGTGLFGTAEQVHAQLPRIEALGCDHVTFLADFGGLEPGAVEQSIRSLAAA